MDLWIVHPEWATECVENSESEQYFLKVVCVSVFQPLENGKPEQLTLSLFCFHCLEQAHELPYSPTRSSSVNCQCQTA